MIQDSFRTKVLNFWQAFGKEEHIIREMIDNEVEGSTILSFTESILKTAFNEISFQIGIGAIGKYELTLSPEGDRTRLIQYYYWYKHAPTKLKNKWIFHPSKPAFKDCTDKGTELFGITLSCSDLILYPKIDNQISKIELFVYCPKLQQLSDSKKYSMFFLFLDQHIGEAYSIEYISNIQFITHKLGEQEINIGQLKGLIDRSIKLFDWVQSINPLDCYYSYSATPNISNDWKLREDISGGYSSCPTPIYSYHSLNNECFEKYEKDGIIFAFLFYENSDLTNDQLVDRRTSIKNQIAEVVPQNNIADCTGGAIGFHFSYIDFIIYDLQAFVSSVKEVVKQHNFEEVGISFFSTDTKPILLN